MASSNRHWPSMFKSKPCNTTSATSHHQWQHDINSSLITPTCHRTPYTPAAGCEERTPEPKPRWNPRPEQIRILESIFNSGIVNPPRDEIRKIRAQLQEYGQVGDANVFYWFQNRKSRSKHKQRHLQNTKSTTPPPQTTTPAPLASSSSSSSKSSPNSTDKSLSVGSATVIDLLNSPTGSVNQQPYFQGPSDFLTESFFFPVQKNTVAASTGDVLGQGFCFPDVNNVPTGGGIGDHTSVVENCPSFLLSEFMLMSQKKADEDHNHEKLKMQTQVTYCGTAAPDTTAVNTFHESLSLPNPTSYMFQGDVGPTKSTVFINDVCFEVGPGPFNVREAFGDDAVLIHSSGQQVLTNDWGLTLQPLQHNSFYYLVRTTFAPSPVDRTMHLI